MASILGISSLLIFFLFHLPTTVNSAKKGLLLFDSIYQFGDSISDTGNFPRMNIPNISTCAVPPYGETFFQYPTGRCTDGLLMVDFIAKALGLPFLNPYMDAKANFSHGVDFSIAGATILDAAALQAVGLTPLLPCCSLPVQMDWFKTYLQQQGCKAKLQTSLFLMGTIGGNDINISFMEGKSFDYVYSLIPIIVEAIKNAVQDLINVGATYIVVPGNFPIGCIPIYLVNGASNLTSDYDDLKCLKAYNQVAQVQNRQIQEVIRDLQEQNPNAIVIYADYYNAYIWLLQNTASLGWEEDQVFNQCCGSLLSNECGSKEALLCTNPKARLSWDGVHPTHEANKYMADWTLNHVMEQIHEKYFHTSTLKLFSYNKEN